MPYAATTNETRPCALRVRATLTSTSWPRAARNAIRRSAENPRAMPDDDLEHAAPAEPLQALDRPILLAALRGRRA